MSGLFSVTLFRACVQIALSRFSRRLSKHDGISRQPLPVDCSGVATRELQYPSESAFTVTCTYTVPFVLESPLPLAVCPISAVRPSSDRSLGRPCSYTTRPTIEPQNTSGSRVIESFQREQKKKKKKFHAPAKRVVASLQHMCPYGVYPTL